MVPRALVAVVLLSSPSLAQTIPLEAWARREAQSTFAPSVLGVAQRWKAETRSARKLFGVLSTTIEGEGFYLQAPGPAEFTFALHPTLALELDQFVLSVSPVLGLCLGGSASGETSVVHSLKGAWAVTPELALGFQYEADLGAPGTLLPLDQQAHALLATFEWVLPFDERSLSIGAAFGHGAFADDAWRGEITIELN